MTKVSAPTFVVCGLGDPKVSPALSARVADGLPVNIPVLCIDRLTWGGTVLDSLWCAVNVHSNQQSSLDRKIRPGVYLSCDRSFLLAGEIQMTSVSWKSFARRSI